MREKTYILTATDLSDWAQKAESKGAEITKAIQNAEMLLVNVQEQNGFDVYATLMARPQDFSQDIIRQKAESILQESAEQLAQKEGITVTPIIRFGDVAKEIRALLNEKKVSLLVIGAHGQGYHFMPILGNIPVKVLQHSPCPVLVIRQQKSQSYRRVLIPINFTEISIYQVLQALPFIPKNAEIILMNVCESPSASRLRFANVTVEILEEYRKKVKHEAESKIKELIEAIDSERNFSIHVEVGIPHEAILKYVKSADIDLLVLGKQPRNRLEDYLIGSTIHYALNEAECDVLITPSTMQESDK